jgi:hypothetical protein
MNPKAIDRSFCHRLVSQADYGRTFMVSAAPGPFSNRLTGQGGSLANPKGLSDVQTTSWTLETKFPWSSLEIVDRPILPVSFATMTILFRPPFLPKAPEPNKAVPLNAACATGPIKGLRLGNAVSIDQNPST